MPSETMLSSGQQNLLISSTASNRGATLLSFAPRQTGKTTFFQWALDALAAEGITYFPVSNWIFRNIKTSLLLRFLFNELYENIREEIEKVFQKRGQFTFGGTQPILGKPAQITDHLSMRRFFTGTRKLC